MPYYEVIKNCFVGGVRHRPGKVIEAPEGLEGDALKLVGAKNFRDANYRDVEAKAEDALSPEQKLAAAKAGGQRAAGMLMEGEDTTATSTNNAPVPNTRPADDDDRRASSKEDDAASARAGAARQAEADERARKASEKK